MKARRSRRHRHASDGGDAGVTAWRRGKTTQRGGIKTARRHGDGA